MANLAQRCPASKPLLQTESPDLSRSTDNHVDCICAYDYRTSPSVSVTHVPAVTTVNTGFGDIPDTQAQRIVVCRNRAVPVRTAAELK